jgi:hypothetical protein
MERFVHVARFCMRAVTRGMSFGIPATEVPGYSQFAH